MSHRFFVVCTLAFAALTIVSSPQQARSSESRALTSISIVDSPTTSIVFSQLKNQLQATELTLQRNRVDAEAAAERCRGILINSVETMEFLTSQRIKDLDLAHNSQGKMLTIAASLSVVGLVAFMTLAFAQWQSLNHLARISTALPGSPALGVERAIDGPPRTAPPLAPKQGDPGSARLETIEELEKRVRELEHAREPFSNAANQAAPEVNSRPGDTKQDPGNHVTNAARFDELVGKGQSLLSLNQATDALACFEEATALDPKRPEVLVKKGTALEQLGRWDEAIEFYDRAIAADHSLTLAYLRKGGIFNRLQRCTEALDCYERALRNHARKPPLEV